MNAPTAQTCVVPGTVVTPCRSLSALPGLGFETTLQCVPFQCSMTVAGGELVLRLLFPTVQMFDAETAATDVRTMLPRLRCWE